MYLDISGIRILEIRGKTAKKLSDKRARKSKVKNNKKTEDLKASFNLNTKKIDISTCSFCNNPALKLTKDHVIPRWLISTVHALHIPRYRGVYNNKIQRMCLDCNRLKSGSLDYTNKEIRYYVKCIIEELEKELIIQEFNDII